jgi:hypothetical protein
MLRLAQIGREGDCCEPRLRGSAKLFGRHRSGIIRNGVVREVTIVEPTDAELALPAFLEPIFLLCSWFSSAISLALVEDHDAVD